MNWRNPRRRGLEDELEKELRFHLEERAAELMDRGVPEDEAGRQARIELGGAAQVKESCRDVWRLRWLSDFRQDIRYTVRMLRRQPAFAAVTLATLALGIGATTVIFTLVDSVLLKPLPFPHAERLVAVDSHQENSRFAQLYLSYPDFQECRRSRFLDLAGWVYNSATLSEPGDAEYEQQFEISNNLFTVLGVRLWRGREFLPDEDRPGGAPAAILGYSLWQRHFGGEPSTLGKTLVLDGKRYTVVGIAPPAFELDGEGDLYTPLGQDPAPYLRNRRAHPVRGIARLRPGATLAGAQDEMAALARGLAEHFPDTNRDLSLRVKPLRPDVGDVRSTLWLLLAAVTLVLLVGCANVASLMLARAVARERELAMRAALGAGRWRLVRQCLAESALLGLGGGALGVLLAAVGLKPFLRFWPGDLPRAAEVHLDAGVLAFACAISVLSGILFGLAPALRVPAGSLDAMLRAGARAVSGGSRRVHGALVSAEIALALVLLVAAGMLGRTLLVLSARDPGVDVRNVMVSRMALSPSVLSDPARIRVAWEDVLERARRVPGVQSATMVDTVPMRQGHNENTWWTSASLPPADRQPVAITTCVTPDYLKVMGIPLRAGRFFNARDRVGSRRVVVIDDVLARTAFPAQDPVGRQLWIPDMGTEPQLIVGVVGHVRYWGLAGDDQSTVRAQFYYPFAQVPDMFLRRWSDLMSIAVRTTVPPLTVVQPLRRDLRGEANDQVLYEVRTLEQLAAASLGRQRFLLLLFGILAGLSLLLAVIGIYGVLAYLTGLRVPEFGVRMALGATPGDVRRLVFRQSLRMIAAGVTMGTAASIAAARVLHLLVKGMQPAGASIFALMIGVLAVPALTATFLPARRAERTDPIQALRQD